MNYKVFCLELKRLVSGEEVWELKHGRARVNHGLTFKCSDEECAAQFIVRNCAAYLEAWETNFRLYPRSQHRTGCSFEELQRQQRNTVIRKKNRLSGKRRRNHFRQPSL